MQPTQPLSSYCKSIASWDQSTLNIGIKDIILTIELSNHVATSKATQTKDHE
jgi:hypothetical protein